MADKILGKVDPDRRSFIKRILGASFAVPVIATFSIESLTSNVAFAQENQSNQFDNQLFLELMWRG